MTITLAGITITEPVALAAISGFEVADLNLLSRTFDYTMNLGRNQQRANLAIGVDANAIRILGTRRDGDVVVDFSLAIRMVEANGAVSGRTSDTIRLASLDFAANYFTGQ